MAGKMMLFMVVSLLFAAPVVYAASHTVGGTSGWDEGVDYPGWASGETFTVGDTLVFNYQLNHAVDQVSATDYTSCSSANPIKSYTGGANTITLSTEGDLYFICPISDHCTSGKQALSITVAAATTPSPSPPGVTASPPPPGVTASPPPPTGTTPTTSSPPPPSGNKAVSLVASSLGSLACVVFVVLMSV